MINGDPKEFIDTIYTCQDIIFVYDGIKYWFQWYIVDGKVHMKVFQYVPAKDGYIWEYMDSPSAKDKTNLKMPLSSTAKPFGRLNRTLSG